MSQRLKEIVQKGDRALLEQAQKDARAAYQLPAFTTARDLRDLRDLPCERRVGVISRTFTKLVEKRDELKFKIDRVGQKVRVAAQDPTRDLSALSRASDELMTARSHLTGKIDAMRPIRKHVERVCRIRK